MTEQEKVNAACFLLIKAAHEANADALKVTQKNVKFLGEELGTWRISVEKLNEQVTIE